MLRKAMEASSSSMVPAEGLASDLEKREILYATSCDDEPTYRSGNESYGHDEDNTEAFEMATSSDGESLLPSEFDVMLDLRQEIQQGEPSANKEVEVEEAVLEVETGKEFEQFAVVQGHSGHHFANYKTSTGSSTGKKITKLLGKLHIIKKSSEKNDREKLQQTGPTPVWVRRIQHEWKSLEKDLPVGIYVRVYEERMELLRAAIVGPAGTPYHDGLFFFDICLPSNYPFVPPLVYYHSHGLRLNPNLYQSGKVCLSLLGTWYGRGCENWNPTQSTLLQVLVSIQGIVFNPKPYFNEPVLSRTGGISFVKKLSLNYNETVFLLSCKTMLYTLRQPPKHFEDLVASHFRRHGRAILLACKAYMEGATVGSEALSAGQGKSCSASFLSYLKSYFKHLLKEFKAKGADCEGLVA